MDIVDLQKKKESLIIERQAIEKKHTEHAATLADKLAPGLKRMSEINLQIQMLDKAIAHPAAAASIAAFIVSQSAQENSG